MGTEFQRNTFKHAIAAGQYKSAPESLTRKT